MQNVAYGRKNHLQPRAENVKCSLRPKKMTKMFIGAFGRMFIAAFGRKCELAASDRKSYLQPLAEWSLAASDRICQLQPTAELSIAAFGRICHFQHVHHL